MKLSFTTLACPDWSLDEIVSKAAEYGYSGVDFRGTREGLDVTLLPEFQEGIGTTKRKLVDAGLVVTGISSGICLCDSEKLEQNLEEARRSVEVALALDAPQVRVFGYGDLRRGRAALVDHGKRCVDKILELDGADRLLWLLEMHDHWIDSQACIEFQDTVGRPEFQLLWDIGHSTRVGSESPHETLDLVADRVRCVHLKDASYDPRHGNAIEDGWRFRLPGEGELPLAEAVRALQERAFSGWYVFEHEKRWHPSLEEPEIALPAYIRWMRQFA